VFIAILLSKVFSSSLFQCFFL
jgi:hypothetical protein